MDQTKPEALKRPTQVSRRLHHQQKQRKFMTVRQALHFLCWLGGKIISWAILLNLCCASIEQKSILASSSRSLLVHLFEPQIQKFKRVPDLCCVFCGAPKCILWCTQVYSVYLVYPGVLCAGGLGQQTGSPPGAWSQSNPKHPPDLKTFTIQARVNKNILHFNHCKYALKKLSYVHSRLLASWCLQKPGCS